MAFLHDRPVESYEEFLLDEVDIQQYRKAMRLSSYAELPESVGLYAAFFGFLGIVWNVLSHPASAAVTRWPILAPIYPWNGPASISEVVNTGAALIVSIMIFYIGFRVRKRFESIGKSTGVNSKSLSMHILARGVENFRNGEYETALDKLEEFDNYEDVDISSELDSSLNQYLNIPEENNDYEYIEETYEDFVNCLMEGVMREASENEKLAMVIVNPDKYDKYEDDEGLEESMEQQDVSYFSIIKKSIPDVYPTGIKLHFWVLYLMAAGIGFSVFLFIDESMGILSIMVLLTGLQIYDRQGRDENVNE